MMQRVMLEAYADAVTWSDYDTVTLLLTRGHAAQLIDELQKARPGRRREDQDKLIVTIPGRMK